MKEVLIACRMLEAETRAALEQTGASPEVIWMDKGLHNRPEDLRDALQEALKAAEAEYHPDRVLLAFGFCGNAMDGIRAGDFELILPRIDDCIVMFIGSRKRKAELEGGVGTMFQTSDWTETKDKSLLSAKLRMIEQFGEDEGPEIFDMLYGNYHRIAVLDTHCFPLEPVVERTKAEAEALGFEHAVYDASNEYLRRLLTGPWDPEAFIVKGPGEAFTARDLWID